MTAGKPEILKTIKRINQKLLNEQTSFAVEAEPLPQRMKSFDFEMGGGRDPKNNNVYMMAKWY